MKVLHSRVALTCALLLALAGTSSAQVRRAQNAPQPPVEVERDTRTAQPPAERPYAINHRTAGRVFQDYYLGPSDAVPSTTTTSPSTRPSIVASPSTVQTPGTASLGPR